MYSPQPVNNDFSTPEKKQTLAGQLSGSHDSYFQIQQTPQVLRNKGYTVLQRVASSSTNVISKVRCEHDGEAYVCKAMTLQNLHTMKARLSAQQEVSVLKALQHPNIIAYKDSWITDNANEGEVGENGRKSGGGMRSLIGDQLITSRQTYRG